MRLALLLFGALGCAAALGAASPSPSDTERKSALDPEGRSVAVFAPGQPEAWRWTGGEAVPGAARVAWTLEGWDGRTEAGAAPVEAGKTPRFALTPARTGWFRLRAQLVDAGGAVLASDETTLAVGTKPERAAARPFRYGMAAHLSWALGRGDEALYLSELDLLDELGADMLRDGGDWAAVEPARGQWAFEKMDRLVDDCLRRGIHIQALLAFSSRWGSTGDPNAKNWLDWARAMPQLEPWLEYVRTIVKRYAGKIGEWEVWNEPDHSFWLGTPDDYALLFSKSAEAVAAASPDARVLNGGYTFLMSDSDVALRRAMKEKADRAHWAIFAYHDYMTLGEMTARAPTVAAYLKESGLEALPVWINEGGCHTLAADGERRQALELVRKMAMAPSIGVQAYFWYDLRDDGADGSDVEHRFGLSDFYARPKPAYAAYRNLIGELAGLRYVPGAPPTPGVPMAVFAGPKTNRLVLWREGKGLQEPVLLSWEGGGRVAAVRDMMGNPVERLRLGASDVVALGSDPLYVDFEGPAAYPVVRPLMKLPDIVALVPGGPASLEVGLSNPTGAPLRWTLRLRPDATASGAGAAPAAEKTAEVAPGASASVVLDWAGAGSGAASAGAPPPKIVLEAAPGDGPPFRAVIPCEAARLVPRAGQPPLALVLAGRENLVNLHDAQAVPELQWKGPADLSVKAALAYDDQALRLEVDVTDDRHSPAASPFTLWQGDSLQVALRLRDRDASYLEFDAALDAAGHPRSWVTQNVPGGKFVPGALPADCALAVTRADGHTLYRLALPWADLGEAGPPHAPFRLDFLVNDNDGQDRKQWIELSPGIGKEKDPSRFPLFLCH